MLGVSQAMADGSDCEANPQCSLDEATEGEMAENINYRSSMDSGQTLDKPPPLPEKVPRSCSLPVPAVGEPPLLPPRSRPGPALPLPSPPIQPVTGDTTQSVAGSEASRREQWLSEDQAVAEMTTVQKLSEKPDSLPAVIRFVDGYYGQTSHFSVSAGDHFQMHFLRHSEILEVQDISRRKYAIPLASTMKLGLLLDELEHTCNPLSMAGVLAIKKLPQVLYAVTDVLGKKGREVVREGDILIAKEKTHKALKCLNLTTKSDVLLEKSFTGKFTLDSEATMMYPREIVQHLPAVFPCKARVFDQTGTSKGPMGLGGKVITLLGANTEICLVANEVRPGSRAGDGVNIINFPVDGTLGSLRVEVLDVEDKKLLCDDACKVFQNFDPSSAITYANVGTDTAFDIQNTLYQELCSDQDTIELVISEALKNASEKDKVTQVDKDSKTEEKKEMKRPTDAVHQSMAESESDSDEYDVIDPALFSESLSPPKPRAATTLPLPPPLPQNKPKRPVRLTPQCTTESESSDHYSSITDTEIQLRSSPKPAVKPRLPENKPKRPVRPTSQFTTKSESSADHYSTITDTEVQLRSSPKPAVKPRLPENKPKRPARPTSQFTMESESSADHYSTITDTKAQLRSRPKPAVKPRPGSAARKQAISDTTHHLSQSQSPTAPGPGSGYTTLIPPQWRQEPYSTVGPLPAPQCPPVVPGSHQTKVKNEPFLKDIGLDPRPLSASEGPPIVPRRNTPDSHQLSQITELRLTREKNKAFLKEMSPAQVLYMHTS